ncbi:hypothetical protein [Nostoc punctiforme]|nr:hypothetical protein [Nostoc punctiforme]
MVSDCLGIAIARFNFRRSLCNSTFDKTLLIVLACLVFFYTLYR